MTKRDRSIIRMRNEGISFGSIGSHFNITPERARQIVENTKRVFCMKHESNHLNECAFCILENECKRELSKASIDTIIQIFVPPLILPNRTKKSVIMRQLIIKILYDKYKKSYRGIGKILNRHHSTIMNLYKQ